MFNTISVLASPKIQNRAASVSVTCDNILIKMPPLASHIARKSVIEFTGKVRHAAKGEDADRKSRSDSSQAVRKCRPTPDKGNSRKLRNKVGVPEKCRR
jgi:hypothetical protein